MTTFFLVLGFLASLALFAWIGYGEGVREARRDVDNQIEVVRCLSAYGVTLRLESARSGLPISKLLDRDGLKLTAAERSVVDKSATSWAE